MVEGVLIAESLIVGCRLSDLELVLISLERVQVGRPADGQPGIWTLLTFRSAADPDVLAAKLSRALTAPGWYIDYRDEQRTWVIYPHGTVFTYHRGDATARLAAVEHGRQLGIPAEQLDWQH